MREAPHDDVRQGGRSLPLARRHRLDAVDEVHVEVGVGAQRLEVVVVIIRRDGRDSDFAGRGGARGDQPPRPAQGLDGLVLRGRCAHGGDLGGHGVLHDDGDVHSAEPAGRTTRTGDPADGHLIGEGGEQRTPYRGEFGDPDDVDRPEQCPRVFEAAPGRDREVRRPHHGGRQARHDRLLEAADRSQARVIAGARRQVDPGPPNLAQGLAGGVRHAGQILDAVQPAEVRDRQGLTHRNVQRVGVDRFQEASREARRHLFEGRDLDPVPASARRLEADLPHSEPTVSDEGDASKDRHQATPADCDDARRTGPIAGRVILKVSARNARHWPISI